MTTNAGEPITLIDGVGNVRTHTLFSFTTVIGVPHPQNPRVIVHFDRSGEYDVDGRAIYRQRCTGCPDGREVKRKVLDPAVIG